MIEPTLIIDYTPYREDAQGNKFTAESDPGPSYDKGIDITLTYRGEYGNLLAERLREFIIELGNEIEQEKR